jgi:hypothetical protein
MLSPTTFDPALFGVSFTRTATGSDAIVSVSTSHIDKNVTLSYTGTTFNVVGTYTNIFTNDVIDYILDSSNATSEVTSFSQLPSKYGSIISYVPDPGTSLIVTYKVTTSSGLQAITHSIDHNYQSNKVLLTNAVSNGEY